ncbi:cell wall-binding repeat-containing protein [Agromyces aurantiacus]|uniref:Cell wall-binding repeat-containing protein n=1 Tax=Agromyces aurantiacus TaxID=165814 RepID=A0ABV9RAU7_9MICO|nr:cell wall-binding repeat-containing protein [Agromyces aurantiacus]MBM7504145.1 putative cell wall-binding protein [Agromyces aurantiacus]
MDASADSAEVVGSLRSAGTGSISGLVEELVDYNASAPLDGATVTAHTYDPATDTLSAPIASATSSVDGTYVITGLAAGDYLLLVRDATAGSKLLPEFYANQVYAAYATAVTVADGQAVAGIDEVLAPMLSDYIAGASRYETSAAIAAEFPADAKCVYVASGANFPDALSAAPAAATCGGPLLLVQPTSVPSVIADELVRLNPTKIYIAGGTGAVSSGVQSALAQLVPGASVVRLAGADRYATSRAIVNAAFGATDFVWIATGVNFPDALAASNAAAAYREPVLIVPGSASSLDSATMTTIANRSPMAVAIAGGTGVVSTGIENQLWSLYGKIRLAGADRYGTSVAINSWAWSVPDGSSSVFAFVTNGTKFPDALSGAALAGGLAYAPMYTVPPTCVPDAVQQHIADLGVYETYLLGYFSEISFEEPLKHC